MAHVEHIWNWLRDWSVYILPALSNLILVLLGIIMSLPKLAEAIEDTPRHRKLFSGACLVFGFVGFVFEVSQRHNGDQQTRQLVGNMDTLVKNTSDLVTKTTGLVTSTNQTVNTLGLLLPQVAGLQDQFRTYVAKSEIARKQGNERLAAALQAQADLARHQASIITRQYLLNIAPHITDQMQAVYDDWKARQTSVRGEPPRARFDPQYLKDLESLAQQYTASLKPTLVNANSIKEQLLDTVPVEVREKPLPIHKLYPYSKAVELDKRFILMSWEEP